MPNTFLRKRAIQADKRDFPASAVESFARHLKKQPDDVLARFRLAENLRALGRLTDAKAALAGVRNVPPEKQWFVHLCRGEYHMDIGEFRKAERWFRKAATLKATSTIPWIYLGGSLAKQERFAEACEALEAGLKARGDIDEVYLNLGNAKRAMGDYDAARKCFRKACSLDPHYEEAKLALQDLAFLKRTLSHPESSLGTFLTKAREVPKR